MSYLRRHFRTVIVGSARAAGQFVKEARQIANGATVAIANENPVEVPASTVATLAGAAHQLIKTAPALVAAAQELATRTVNVLRSPAGQRAAGLLAQLALATATRAVVRTAFGPIAGNIAAGVVGVAAGIREVQVAATSPATASDTKV